MKHRMTTQPQTDAHPTQISAETERVLRDCVRAVVSRLSQTLKDQALEWEVDSRWERGTDGHFREYTKRTRKLWPILNDEWLRSLPDYDTCVEHLKSDEVVGPHLDRIVGPPSEAHALRQITSCCPQSTRCSTTKELSYSPTSDSPVNGRSWSSFLARTGSRSR
jgi:hypothetical protein